MPALLAGLLGARNHPLCAKRVVASLDLDLAIRCDHEPVSRTSRRISPSAADDEQVIPEETIFHPMPIEELKDLRIVVLMDLKPGGQGQSFTTLFPTRRFRESHIPLPSNTESLCLASSA
jgi:hypothetical protein